MRKNRKMSRRQIFGAGLGLLAGGAALPAVPHSAGAKTVLTEGGGHTQDWFLDSFLEFRDDLEESTKEGKRFAILWEQDGCPYCRELHLVNFARPEIDVWVRERFNIVQMNIWGSRETIDFDGKEGSEKQLAKRAGVRFTPTIQFFPETLAGAGGKDGRSLEVARMPGYFKPFHFLSLFKFVHAKAYETEKFRAFLKREIAELERAGGAAESW